MKKMRIKVNGKVFEVEVEVLEEHEYHVPSESGEANDIPVKAPARPSPSEPSPAADTSAIRSPLAGTVISILANEGDSVAKNSCVCTLESMKMETKINSPVAGKIKKVVISKGQMVQQNQILFELE